MDSDVPHWQLLGACARKLTAEGRTPFTRQDLIACVRQTRPDANPDSLNPMIQGITVNAKGGAPGGKGKRILWRVGYGRYELYQGQDGGDSGEPGAPLDSAAATPPTTGPGPNTVTTPSPDSYSGDSSAQRRAEDWLGREVSAALGTRLEKRRFASDTILSGPRPSTSAAAPATTSASRH